MEEARVMQATEKGNIQKGGYHLRIQCSAPPELAAFMRKRHLNNDSTAHNSSTISRRVLMEQASELFP